VFEMTTTPTVSVAEALAQLPEELQRGTPPDIAGPSALALAIGSTVSGDRSQGRPPIGRFSRFWTLGTLQGKIAAGYAFWWFRSMWQGTDERQRSLNEHHLRAAVQLLGTMSTLRGAVMKVGQMLAHWPGCAPEEFADVLGRLHFEAPPMHGALVREQVHAELGSDPEVLFAEFDLDRACAASLGQVHRARLRDGHRHSHHPAVAVKVQYPGIARTIRDDVANLRLLLAPLRMGSDGSSVMVQLDDIERMLALETDYLAEAENLRRASEALAGIDEIVVPEVHEELSNARILTMRWLDGVHLPHLLAERPDQGTRNRWGALIARAVFRLGYRARLLHADIHPGNFLFMPDGRLGLIDFGCMRRYTQEEYDYMCDAERAATLSPEAVRELIVRGSDLTLAQQADPERLRLLTAWYDWICEPTLTDRAFDFGDRRYFDRGMNIWREILMRRYIRTLPINNWVGKGFIGLRAMLTGLGAQVPLGQIMREETTVSGQ
jgi:aarF domain-containing kinase